MKRILLTIMLAFFVVFGVNAQEFGLAKKSGKADLNKKIVKSTLKTGLRTGKAVFLSETFDADIPATWTVNNTGTGTYPGWFWTSTDGNFSFTGFAIIDSDANGSGNTTVGELISPAFDCSAAAAVNLEFDARYNDISNGDAELFTVDVYDGSAWQNVLTWDEDHGDATTPEHVSVDISAYKNAACQVRFVYSDDGWDWYAGVDNISVVEPDPHDLGVDAVTPTIVLSGSTVTPTVTVHNYGTSDEATWSVQLTDGAGYDNTVADAATITLGSDYVINFPDWTPADGNYTLTATVTLTGDANTANDVLAITCNVSEVVTAYGWDAYVVAGGVTAGPVNVLLPVGTLVDISTDASDFVAGADWADGVWYGGQNTSNALVSIDAATGAMTTIGTMGGVNSVTGLAYDVNTSTMYVADYNGTGTDLYTVDLTDATTTLVGSVSANGLIIGIACDFAGNIFGIDLADDQLYSIDAATGAGTAVGALGVDINYAQDIAFDRNNDVLYGTLYTTTGGLYTIDVSTGAATLLYNFQDEITGFAIPYTIASSVEEIINANFSIYPNPSNGQFTINVEKDFNLEVFDITGKVITTRTLTGSTTLELNTAGVYFLRFSNEEGSVTQRVVVQ